MTTRMIAAILTSWITVTGMGTAGAQTGAGAAFPLKPVRIITSDPGGGSDVVVRAIVPATAAGLGQPVVVDNRAGGVIAGELVSRAPPDGHTLIYYGNSLWLLPLMREHVPYDTVRDFMPVTLAVTSPNILVVHPSLPVKSVKDLIALAKARPGELNYASAAIGTSNHLAAALFNHMAGVTIVRIGYKGMGAAVIDLLGGQVQILFATATVAAPHVKSGRMKALAVSSAQPSVAYPGLPTIAASGLPGYESALNAGVLAPAKTPDAIIRRLHQEFARALNSSETREKFKSMGVDVLAGGPEQFAAKIKSEIASVSKLIKETGIRAE